MEAVDGTAKDPGEVAGPAVRFSVIVTNGTANTVPLTTTVVNVDYGSGRTPAGELQEPGAVLFPAEVAAGQSATAVYVFTVPSDQRTDVRITVDYSVDVAPLVFQGAVPA